MLTALVMSFSFSPALAQLDMEGGNIGVFADDAGTSCNLSDAPGVLSVYFLCLGAIDATASQWAAPHPTCLHAEHISDVCAFPIYIGDTETGIIVGYPTCKVGTFLIVTATYNVLESATECCRWSVVPDPSLPSGKIETVDCFFMVHYPPGGQAVVNATPECTCSVPTEDTTWGKLKALYAN